MGEWILTFFKVSYVLLILFLSPLVFFEIGDAFADEINVGVVEKKRITYGAAATSTMTITNVSTGSLEDRLLIVGVSLNNQGTINPDGSVLSVVFDPTGTCGVGPINLDFVTGSLSTAGVDTTSNMFYNYTSPPKNKTCDITVTLDQVYGFHNAFNVDSAVVRSVVFSNVDQINPIVGFIGYTNSSVPTGISQTPNVDVGVIAGDFVIMDMVSADSSNGIGNPTIKRGPDQTVKTNQISYPQTGTGPPLNYPSWFSGTSFQRSGAADNIMSWSYTTTAAPWAISAIVINSCENTSSCTTVSSGSGSGNDSGCDGDCTPPTLGLDKNNNRVVSDGFSFNDNPVDAEYYYTPYPLITAYVGEENSIKLVIYENEGPANLAHIGVAFGLGHGETYAESGAIINWDRDYNGIEKITLDDPENVLENIRVEVEEVDCVDIGSRCTSAVIYHTFRAPLEFNMVATNIWDHDRNSWQNYFNHGVQIIGDSLNPPKIYDGIYKGKIYPLTEIENNKSVDKDGNFWTFDYGIWNRDYVDTKKTDHELVNADKIWAINHVLNKYSIGGSSDASSYQRSHDQFSIQKEYQIILAESLLEEICPKCFDDEFEGIDDISYYDFDVALERIDDPEFVNAMKYEAEMAEFLLEEMMNSYYPGRVYEEE